MTSSTVPSLASIHLDELRREADAEHLANEARRRRVARQAAARQRAFALWVSRLNAGWQR